MIFNCGPRGSGSSSGIDFGGKFNPMRHLIFSYNDKTNISLEDIDDGICEFTSNDDKWELKILQNCNIEFTKQAENIIVFMVGGGDGGKCGQPSHGYVTPSNYDTWYAESQGGAGGNGGKIFKNSYSFLKEKIYTFKIGLGGSAGQNIAKSKLSDPDPIDENRIGGDSQILLNNDIKLTTSNSINQAAGGNGAYSEGSNYGGYYDGGVFHEGDGRPDYRIPAESGEDGTIFHNIYYGSGGGGGRNYVERTQAYIFRGKHGGKNGGGHGMGYNDEKEDDNVPLFTEDEDDNLYADDSANTTLNPATSGLSNTGGGGGGGSATYTQADGNIFKNAAAGGSGIIILSNYDNE